MANVPEGDIARSPVGIMSGAKEMNYRRWMKERAKDREVVNEQKRLPRGIGRERKFVFAIRTEIPGPRCATGD